MGNSASIDKYSIEIIGKKYTPDFTVYITENNKRISSFHSIPLFMSDSEEIVTIINEIPRFENGKFEITKNFSLNPIKQDIKKDNVRFVPNLFPFKGYMWNYGAMPQTWEDKDEICDFTKCKGDNDPLDVLDISNIRKEIGEVYQGKVLGCLAMIDNGECDWKIIVIDIKDPLSKLIKNEEDIEKYFPKYIEYSIYWLKNYKVPDGKPKNIFGLNGKFMDKNFAMDIVKVAHKSWKKLISLKHVSEIFYETEGDLVKSNKKSRDLSEFLDGFAFIKK